MLDESFLDGLHGCWRWWRSEVLLDLLKEGRHGGSVRTGRSLGARLPKLFCACWQTHAVQGDAPGHGALSRLECSGSGPRARPMIWIDTDITVTHAHSLAVTHAHSLQAGFLTKIPDDEILLVSPWKCMDIFTGPGHSIRIPRLLVSQGRSYSCTFSPSRIQADYS